MRTRIFLQNVKSNFQRIRLFIAAIGQHSIKNVRQARDSSNERYIFSFETIWEMEDTLTRMANQITFLIETIMGEEVEMPMPPLIPIN